MTNINTSAEGSTDWHQEARRTTALLYNLLRDVQDTVQTWLPGATLCLIVRDVLLEYPRPSKDFQEIIEIEGQDFLLTRTGAAHLSESPVNDQIRISFVSKKQDQNNQNSITPNPTIK